MFKHAYTPDDSLDTATVNNEESLTVQSDAEECDINFIMKRYSVTGQLPQLNAIQPLFEDFTEVTDYRGALELIRDAKEAFLNVPAHIRAQFGNDPQAFINFAVNPENIDQMRKWGLANPAEKKDTTSVNTTTGEIENGQRPEGHRNARSGTQSDGSGNTRRQGLPEGTGDDRLHEEPTRR